MTLHLHCTQCGAKASPKCNCQVPHDYIPAHEAAARGIAAHPDWSNRRIAKLVGVGQHTVDRAREPTEPNGSVERRTGQDGRRRRAPTPVLDRARAQVRSSVEEGRPVNARRVAEQSGISHVTIETAIAAERARLEAREFEITPDMLSMSAQRKLENAIVQHQRRLDREFRERVRLEVQRQVRERAYPRMVDMIGDAQRVLTARRRGIFSKDEYNVVLRCVHPDLNPTIDQKNEAFRLLHEKKITLLSNVDDPRTYSGLPTVEEMMSTSA